LGAALVAKPFIGERDWMGSLAQAGALLLGVGAALLLGWVTGAVGIIGSEDNTASLMYGGVLLVGAAGAAVARLR
jgi:hypothetical protein